MIERGKTIFTAIRNSMATRRYGYNFLVIEASGLLTQNGPARFFDLSQSQQIGTQKPFAYPKNICTTRGRVNRIQLSS
jgi:hypothetical protein